jgi:hypothetical protein
MKQTSFTLGVILLLVFVSLSYAQDLRPGSGPHAWGYYGRGWGEGYSPAPGMSVGNWGPPRGPGHGPDMYGHRYNKHMTELCEKFLDETATLRKDFLLKTFDLDEAFRKPDAKKETVERLLKEQADLDHKIHEKNAYSCWW